MKQIPVTLKTGQTLNLILDEVAARQTWQTCSPYFKPDPFDQVDLWLIVLRCSIRVWNLFTEQDDPESRTFFTLMKLPMNVLIEIVLAVKEVLRFG